MLEVKLTTSCHGFETVFMNVNYSNEESEMDKTQSCFICNQNWKPFSNCVYENWNLRVVFIIIPTLKY